MIAKSEVTVKEDMEIRKAPGRLFRFLKPFFWQRKNSYKTWLILILATALMFGSASAYALIGRLAGDLVSAVDHILTDKTNFLHLSIMALVVLVAYNFSKNCYEFLRTKLAIDYREWQTKELNRQCEDKWEELEKKLGLDVVGQILQEELRDFINSLIGFGFSIVVALNDFAVFMCQLYLIGVLLAGGSFVWSLLGTFVIVILGRKLASMNNDRSRTENDLRMAYKDQDEVDHKNRSSVLNELVDAAVYVARKTNHVNTTVASFVLPFNELTQFIAIGLIAWSWWKDGPGLNQVGIVFQAIFAFVRSQQSISVLAQQFGAVSQILSSILRIGWLTEAIAEIESEREKEKESKRSEKQISVADKAG